MKALLRGLNYIKRRAGAGALPIAVTRCCPPLQARVPPCPPCPKIKSVPVVEFLGRRQPKRAAGNGVARLPAVATVVDLGCVFHVSRAFEIQLARALPVGALFDAVQQRDCEVLEGGWSPEWGTTW
jgi:hypothetical protein